MKKQTSFTNPKSCRLHLGSLLLACVIGLSGQALASPTLIPLNIHGESGTEIQVTPPIRHVTVFLRGAEVVREGGISIPQGSSEVVIKGLSPYVDPKSIQVKLGNKDLTILSINHQYDNIGEHKQSAGMALWRERLESIEEQIARVNNKIAVVHDELKFLEENRSLKGTNNGISLANLKSINEYYREQGLQLREKKLGLEKELKQLNEKKGSISREIDQQGELDKKPMGEVHLLISAKRAVSCSIELSYYVDNAGWIPSYDIRSSGVGNPLELSYKATIHQSTREDWNKVHLRISSLDPKISNTPPTQQIYYLNYNTRPPRYSQERGDQATGIVVSNDDGEPLVAATVRIVGTNIATMTDINGRYSITIPPSGGSLEISFIGYQTKTIPLNSRFATVYLEPDDAALNEVVVFGYAAPMREEVKESASRRKTSARDASERNTTISVEQDERQTAVEFDIQTAYSISSNNKPLVLEVQRHSMPASYEYVCVPKADPDAFLLAHVSGWERYKLLSGEANIFYENGFVGKTILDTRELRETLRVSLGRDKGIQVAREKAEDSSNSGFLSSKSEDVRSWITTIRNNKSRPIEITLFDQVPVSTNNEITVKVENLSNGEFDKASGEVKWKMNLQPSERKQVNLKYIVKSPKEKNLQVE